MSTRRPTYLLAALAVGAATFGVAAPAKATTFCVEKPGCQGIVHPTIDAALKASNLPAHPGPDRIEVGEGEFPGPAAVLKGSGAELVGSGRGKTVILGAPGTPAVVSYDEGTRITDLTVRMADVNFVGIDGNEPGITLERIEVQGPQAESASKSGILLRRSGTVRDAIVTMDPAASPVNYGISLSPTSGQPQGEVVLEDIRATGGYGIHISGWSAPVTVRRAILTGGVFGVGVGLPAPGLRLDTIAARVVHSGPYDAGAGLGIFTGIAAATGTSTITARHLTLVSRARGGNGIEVRAEAGQAVAINAREVVALGGADWRPTVVRQNPNGGDPIIDDPQTTSKDIELTGGGAIDLHLSESAWRGGAAAVYASNGRLREDGGNVDLVQHGQIFADVDGGNLAPSGGSVLVDNGTREADGNPDAAGNARPVDGDRDGDARADIGAYEAGAGTNAGRIAPYLQPGSCDAACTEARRDEIMRQLPVTTITKLARRAPKTIGGTAQRAERVRVSVTRIKGKRCQAMTDQFRWIASGKAVKKACAPRFSLLARGAAAWSVRLPRALPAGRYEIAAQAESSLGGQVTPTRRTVTIR